MKGGISLQEFIIGVKNELVSASDAESKAPFFELTEVELEAEFSIETKAKGEGSVGFLIKVAGEAKGVQSHKVVLKFKPLLVDNTGDGRGRKVSSKSDNRNVREVLVRKNGKEYIIRTTGPLYERKNGHSKSIEVEG